MILLCSFYAIFRSTDFRPSHLTFRSQKRDEQVVLEGALNGRVALLESYASFVSKYAILRSCFEETILGCGGDISV